MSEWIKDSFIFYKRHWVGLLSIVLPVAILQEFIFAQWDYYDVLSTTSFQMQSLLPFIGVSMLVNLFLQLYVIYYIQAVLSDQSSNMQAIVGKMLAVLPYFIMLNIFISIAIACGLIALILPGIYIFIKLTLSQYFYLLGNQPLMASMKASWQATKGYFWDLLLGVLVIVLITSLPSWFHSQEPTLINAMLNIISTCLGLVMTIFLYRAYDYVQENPRVVD